MDLISATIYGVIQGLTEFLPVSSSGHLAILPYFLKIEDPGLVFDIAMHLGTALAVAIYFYKDIIELLKALIRWDREDPKFFFAINMIISTIVTVTVVLAMKKFALTFGRAPYLIAFNLVLFAIIMYFADRKKIKLNDDYMESRVNKKIAFSIGFAQSLAIFPGVSRSGITLTMARMLGLSRVAATRYSFLLSLPIILGAFIFKVSDFFKSDLTFDIASCFWGGIFSFLVGILTIHLFLKFISRVGLGVFSLYRIALAIIIILLI